MQELTITTHPAKLDLNYEAFKANLIERLKDYKIVVTEDTVADAKALATELNALKTDIDKRRKAAIAEVSAPIKAADDSLKELVGLAESGRQDVLIQVAKFEDRAKDDALEKARQALIDTRTDMEVREEFHAADVEDMRKLGTLTDKGNLTTKTKQAIRERVSEERRTQDNLDRRLLELENRCYKAGMATPLERQHVEHFILADEEQYNAQLQRLIDTEIQRQQKAEQATRDRMAAEQAASDQAEADRKAREARLAETPTPQAQPEPEPEPQPAPEKPAAQKPAPAAKPSGETVTWEATCVFTTEVPRGATVAQVEAELRRQIEAAGFTTLTDVFASPAQNAA